MRTCMRSPSMFLGQLAKRSLVATILVLGVLCFARAAEPVACGAASPDCLASCKRFTARDARQIACINYCEKKATRCTASEEIARVADTPAEPPKAETSTTETPTTETPTTETPTT